MARGREQYKIGEKNPPRVTVRMSTPLKDRIDALVLKTNKTQNAVLVEAIEQYVEREEQKR